MQYSRHWERKLEMIICIFRLSIALFGLLIVLCINGSLVDEPLILSVEQR